MRETFAAIRRAKAKDVPFIMSTERVPGFEQFIGTWTEEEHLRAIAEPSAAYLLAIGSGSQPLGFATLLHLDEPHGNVFLKRIAVIEPNRGFGTAFIHSLARFVFGQAQVYRFWLDVLESNTRARHVYRKIGFVEEGVLRNAWQMPDGSRRNLFLMSLTRPEWEQRYLGTEQ